LSAVGCANGSTRQELSGIRTEVGRRKFFEALKLWTAWPVPAVSCAVMTTFETLANAGLVVVCRAK
jgi:hypothetical protein